MHKLDRAKVPAPECLGQWDYEKHTWDDFGHPCKQHVRIALKRLQGQSISTTDADDDDVMIGVRCAYCEGPIFNGGHIEHFRRKNPKLGYPKLTFDWDNLFFSCDSQEHCGHFKDRPAAEPYDADLLVKPDNDDPDNFFYFHQSGAVRVRNRDGISENDQKRAGETIRVFNLDCGTLRGTRRHALNGYRNRTRDILDELMTWEPELREEYIRDELEATRWDPYATVIRHFFEK
jgi:uncharacterized protein (TIGR02646 family)